MVDATDRGSGTLEFLQLIRDLLEWPAQKLHVLEEDVHGADGDFARAVEITAEREDEDVTRSEQARGQRPDRGRGDLRPAGRVDEVAADSEVPAHDVAAGSVRPDVVDGSEPLFDEAIQVGRRLSFGIHERHGEAAGPGEGHEGHGNYEGEDQPHAPVLAAPRGRARRRAGASRRGCAARTGRRTPRAR